MDSTFVLMVVAASLFRNAGSAPVFVEPFIGSIFASVGKSAKFSFRFTGGFNEIDFGPSDGSSLKEIAIKVVKGTPLSFQYLPKYQGRISWAGNENSSPMEAVFILSNVNQSDSGKYLCKVSKGSSSAATIKLIVTDANIVEHPESVICQTNGNEVNFTCNATGTPTPNVTWVKSGEEIGESSSVKIVGDGKGYSRLTIKNCGREDVLARYRCKATNPPDLEKFSKPAVLFFAFTANNTAEVDKYSSPSVVKRSVGVETTLRCAFRSYPPPSINWTFPNGSSTQTHLPFLVITPTSSEHFGNYKCSADGFTPRNINLDGGNDIMTGNFVGPRVKVTLGPTISANSSSFYTVTGTREETKEPYLTITKNSTMYLNWDSEVKNIKNKKEKVTLQLEVRYHTDKATKVIRRLRVTLVSKARTLQAGFLAFVVPLVVALSAGIQ